MLIKHLKQILGTALAMVLIAGVLPISQLAAFVATADVTIVEGSSAINFGQVQKNVVVIKEVKVRNNTNQTVFPVLATTPGYPFALYDNYTTNSIAPGNTGSIAFTVNSAIAGTFTEQAEVLYRDSVGSVWERIPLSLSVVVLTSTPVPAGSVALSRSTVDFGTIDANTDTGYTQSVMLYNYYNVPVNFSVIDVPNSIFAYRIVNSTQQIPANGSVKFEFAFRPTQVNQTYSDYFMVRTDATDSSRTYSVRLDGKTRNVVTSGVDENLIRDFTVIASPNLYFNQPVASVDVRFALSQAANVDLKVYDMNNTLITRVFTDRFFSAHTTAQNYTFVLQNALNPNTRYRFELRADTTSSPIKYDTDNYEILISGSNPQPPTGYGCAGFVDVQPGTEFCEAVSYAFEQGIFTGDTGGYNKTLRPNESLIRAEAVAVMLRAVDVTATSNYPVPFYDINEGEWYIPYLRQAVAIGAINGYPDGTFRPYQVMKRAEFYKAFLEMVRREGRANFFLEYNVSRRPFADVTLQSVNRWYLPYADWAVRYFDLSDFAQRHFGTKYLTGSAPKGYFKPEEAITRGEIIELIYETHLRNIIEF